MINRDACPRGLTRITVSLAITPADRDVVLRADLRSFRAHPRDTRQPALPDVIPTVFVRLGTRLTGAAAALRPWLSRRQLRVKSPNQIPP